MRLRLRHSDRTSLSSRKLWIMKHCRVTAQAIANDSGQAASASEDAATNDAGLAACAPSLIPRKQGGRSCQQAEHSLARGRPERNESRTTSRIPVSQASQGFTGSIRRPARSRRNDGSTGLKSYVAGLRPMTARPRFLWLQDAIGTSDLRRRFIQHERCFLMLRFVTPRAPPARSPMVMQSRR